uniref:Large ribosomal subunit protein bL21m n=1 Tax=Monopterus albus TaxID=43700 RepID=A0A3Q3RBH6_MONAL
MRIHRQEFGRLFAVVHFAGRQWKVTDEDLILIENHIEAECGERIRIEKVLLVGAEDFTLIGRPLLGKELVRVEATVIEKTESWPKVHMRFWKRHRFQRKRIIIQPQTVLRINSIELLTEPRTQSPPPVTAGGSFSHHQNKISSIIFKSPMRIVHKIDSSS